MEERENAACGIIPILTLMKLARRRGWEPVTLKYLNSGDTAGDGTQVVGYAAMAWYGKRATVTGENQRRRGRIPDANGQNGHPIVSAGQTVAPVDPDSARPELREKCGAFVTITKNGTLRGCIGNLSADEPWRQSVRDNALRAAFSDPVFPR